MAVISSSHIPFAYPYIDISYCYPFEPRTLHYGIFFHLALHTFSHLGWGPLCVRFAFIVWIGEYCEHIMPLFICYSLSHSWLFFPSLCIFTFLAFEFCFYHLISFHLYFPLCDDDTLMSRSYGLGWSHPSFYP